MMMKRVMAASSVAEADVFRSVLQEAGIACAVRNDQLWVEPDEDYATAQDLCEMWCEPVPATAGMWACPVCGKQLATPSDFCWQCGAPSQAVRSERLESTLPGSWEEATLRSEQMSTLLDSILHQSD
jgi:hypothetical protein